MSKEIILNKVKNSSLYELATKDNLSEEDQVLLAEATKELSINFELLAENLLEILKDQDKSKKFNDALIKEKKYN